MDPSFVLCFVIFAFYLRISLKPCLFVRIKWASWVSFPTNISSHLWVPACNHCKLAECIVSCKVWCWSATMQNKDSGVKETWHQKCAVNLRFHSEAHSWKISLTEETDASSPSPPARKAAIMSNISISFLTYIYGFNSLDNFLADSPPHHLIFPQSWHSSHSLMGIPFAAVLAPSVCTPHVDTFHGLSSSTLTLRPEENDVFCTLRS